MKKFISSLLIATMLVTSSVPAYAADSTVPAATDPLPVITSILKQQPAPFAGILLSPAAVAKVIAESDAATANQKIAVQHQADVDAAQLKYQTEQLTSTCTADKTDLQAQLTDNKNQVNILTNQLKKSSSPLGGAIWFGIGGGAGIVLTVLTVFAIGKVK